MSVLSGRRSNRWVCIVGATAILGILGIGAGICGAYRHLFLANASTDLQAILHLKVENIAAWRGERLADATVLSESPFLRENVNDTLNDPTPQKTERLRQRLESTKKNYRYSDVCIVDLDDRVRFSLSGWQGPPASEVVEALAAVRDDGRPKLTDLHFESDGTTPYVDVIAPITSAAGTISHFIVLQCDARQVLHPVLQSWPTPSRSAEVLLVRRAGDDVLFLNDLRHQAGTMLRLRIPLSRTNVPAVMAAMGQEGVAEGRDYRDVPVMSAFKAIPDSPWFVVVKEDMSEILAPWHSMSAFILAASLMLALVVGVMLLAMRQRDLRHHYESLYRTETQLRERETTLRAITDTSFNAILMMDSDERISYYNPAAERMFGWTQSEAMNQDLYKLLVPVSFRAPYRRSITRLRQSDEGNASGRVVELCALRKGGGEFPVEVALGGVSIKGRWYVVGVVHDISERKLAETRLHESTEKMRAVADVALDAILMMTPQGYISFYNRAAEGMFGWTAEEAVGRDLHDLLASQEFRAPYHEGMARFRDSGEGKAVGQRLELTALRKDGSRFPVEVAVSGIYLRDEWQAVGFVRDITERKRADEDIALEIQRTNSLIRLNQLTLQTASEIVEGVVEDAIRLTGSRIGYLATLNDEESVMTMQYWSKSAHAACAVIDKPIVYPVVDTGLWGEAVRQRRPVITNDYEADNPLKRGTPEGHVRVIRHMNTPVFEGDRIVAVAGVGNKETEYNEGDLRQLQLLMQGWWQIMIRKNAEEKLRASEEKLRQIVENIGFGVLLFGQDMRILEANRRIHEWFPEPGEAAEACGPVCGVSARYSVQKKSCDGCPVELALKDGQVHEGVSTFTIKKVPRTLKLIASPIHDRTGHVTAAIETLEDITERLALERDLAQAQKLESIGRLAAGIAHEINTPTQYVGDNIEFLQIAYEGLIDLAGRVIPLAKAASETGIAIPQLDEMCRLIEDENLEYLARQVPRAVEQSLDGVKRIASIVRAMKEFSHPGVFDKTPTNLNECIRSTVTVSRNEWRYVAELALDLDDSLPEVVCLPGEINQVVLNIIVNAAHAIGDVVGDNSEQKGKISVATRRDGEFVEIRIADTGAGIPEQIRDRIFDPFFTTKEVGRGTGQGLAIARNVVVDKHGGTISVESAPGKGTTFTIRLPIDGAGSTAPATAEGH